MGMGNVFHDIVVRKDDQAKADAIIQRHQTDCNVDRYYVEERFDRDGRKVVYWVCLYVIDDLSVIKQDLMDNGIALF